MPSLASLVNFGTVWVTSSSTTASTTSEYPFSLVRRVSLTKRRVIGLCRCKYSVSTADVVAAEQGSAERENEFVLKPPPRPVLKAEGGNNDRLSGANSAPWSGVVEDRNKAIESLGEALGKAEKLEDSRSGIRRESPSSGSVNENVNRSFDTSSDQRGRRPVEGAGAGMKKMKTMKSVWRKGDSTANIEKVVKREPKDDISVVKEEIRLGGEGKVESQPVVSLGPPQPPLRQQPMLQARPSAAPPPVARTPVLKDVGAAPSPVAKTPVLKDVGAAPKASAVVEVAPVKSKERKQPILIDKFAGKKSGADSPPRTVSGPTKQAMSPSLGKYRFDSRRKNASAGGAKRRLGRDDDELVDEESSELNVSIPGVRRGRKWNKASRRAAKLQAARLAAPVKAEILEVEEKGMLLEELASSLAIGEGEILGYLFNKGIKPDGVQTLDKEMVKMICKEYEVEVIDVDSLKVEDMAKKKEIFDEDDLDKLEDRPPVLTIMGHVDHGKTTLLDYIRKSKVAASEAGGITQGIGAYKVQVPMDGKLQPCIFLDTPGHEAFGAMRARGARVTDIAIIVVAADDGIRPQTTEAIAHAKAAGVPIVIAINKIDKDGANPENVMQELSAIGLMPEDWGGDVPMVQISALKGENVDDLLETVMLVAELQELKANPHRNAKGTVIEAGLEKSKGPVATFIVQNGTLKGGDIVVCGEAYGKVRALFDDSGKRVNEARPSIPVQVIGLNNVPIAGDEFEVLDSLDVARQKAEARAESLRDERISTMAGDGKVTLSSLASAVSSGKLSGIDLHQLNVILKVDLQGSIEAVRQALQILPQDNVTLKFLLEATGDVSASDVDLAVATRAIILGFNVKAPGSVKSTADNKGVEIRLYKVIYDLIDDVRNAMEGLLDSVEEQVPIGSAEVRAVFSSGSGRVAGCMITEGKVVQGCGIRVTRKRKVVHAGTVESLRRVKENVKEVSAGLECGIGMDDYDDWQVGDTLELYNVFQKKRTLEEASASMAAALEGAGIGM